jgi:nucleoside-diphosphate-sugar epimerase
VRATILRLPIVQGEGDGSLRLWAYLERLLDGGPLVLPDGGARVVRHLYAGDVTAAILRVLDQPPREGVYNLAPPDTLTLRELLVRVAALAGVSPRFVDVPWDDLLAAGLTRWFSPYAGPWSSVLDPARAAASWGLAGTRIEDYLPRVVRWHLENRPTESHPGYEHRALELEVARRHGVASGRGAGRA